MKIYFVSYIHNYYDRINSKSWIAIDILNLFSETKINYWFKHLLNCNISAILVAIIKLINNI
jgi:hypothetical protein